VLDGGEWLTPRPGRFTPRERDPVPIAQEVGWASEPVWTFRENLALSGIRSPDRPARSGSLRHPGHSYTSARHMSLHGMERTTARSVPCTGYRISPHETLCLLLHFHDNAVSRSALIGVWLRGTCFVEVRRQLNRL
jgi:hypothetical protein